jgi:hypothetical protein
MTDVELCQNIRLKYQAINSAHKDYVAAGVMQSELSLQKCYFSKGGYNKI